MNRALTAITCLLLSAGCAAPHDANDRRGRDPITVDRLPGVPAAGADAPPDRGPLDPPSEPGTPAGDGVAEPANRAPVMAPFTPQRVVPGELFVLRTEASDPDGDPLEFTLEGEAPSRAEFDAGTGVLRWSPVPGDAGRSYRFAIGATDGEFWRIEPVRVDVVDADGDPADAPPQVLRGGHVVARVGQPTRLRPVVEDEDPSALRFTKVGAWPLDAALDAADGTLRWTPTARDAGRTVELDFEVRDAVGSAQGRFTIQVEAPDAPEPAPDDPEPAPQDPEPAPEDPEPEPQPDAPPVEPEPEPEPNPEPEAGFGHPPGPALEVEWSRLAGGTHLLSVRPDGDVDHVSYWIDGAYAGESAAGPRFEIAVDAPRGEGRLIEAIAHGVDGAVSSEGRAAIDFSDTHAVFVRQVGVATYEIGLRYAPREVEAIAVRADGIPLVDGVSGARQSRRLAVRSHFVELGQRSFEIDTFGPGGAYRGTLQRALVLR